ncbi:hypothetical protein [Halobacillus andaensis]|uniref:hypothetical protein n=1 Tax=Halobacillus andaensis TaxID=1176239 RepID=UPI001E4DE2E2|nr:hypothetical protein [Halobacillus andaensis]
MASYSSLEFKVIGTLVIVSSFSLATYFTKFSHIKPASLGIVFTVLTVTACAGVYFLIEVLFSGVEFFIKLIVVFLTESLAAKSLLKWSGKNE